MSIPNDIKQELDAILREWLEEEQEPALLVSEALQSIDATPEQLRKYLKPIQDEYVEVAQDAKKDSPEDAAHFRAMAQRVAALIKKLK